MKDIIKMVKKFNIKRICETVYGYKPHSAIIGEWIRWWLKDSWLDKERMRRIINPAIGVTYRKKRVFADLMFAEQARRNSKFFKILGVAEVENNRSKFPEKLRSLSFYEQIHKETEDRKFPDLKFGILCCRIKEREDSTETDLIKNLVKECRMYSRNSEVYWVLYLLKYGKAEADYSFRVRNYVKGYPRFWYGSSFFGSTLYIHRGGNLIAHLECKY